MGEKYRVAIHHDNDCGYIEYDLETKKVQVILADAVVRKTVEAFLHSEHLLREAQRTLRDFRGRTAQPTESLASLKLSLTSLWQQTGVFVDWSRPVPTP
jgi:hypothetical protein